MKNQVGDNINLAQDLKTRSEAVQHLPNRSHESRLPRLLFTDLQNSIELYLESRKPLCHLRKPSDVRMLLRTSRENGSRGKLQNRLREAFNDPAVEDWLSVLYTNSIFLSSRVPLHLVHKFFASHPLSKTPHTQAERAAIMAVAAFQLQKMVEMGALEPEYENEILLCNDQFFNITSTSIMSQVQRLII